MNIKFINLKQVPVEIHKPVFVQKLNLKPIDDRLKAIKKAGFNSFCLDTSNIFLDMLTDSGVNAMSTNQLGAMMVADDAYAGSQSFIKLKKSVKDFFGTKLFLPVHQGRAAEHIISRAFVKPGDIVPMNFHFTTTRAQIELAGGRVEELVIDEAFKVKSQHPFKGNMDIKKLEDCINRVGHQKIPFIRMEVTTNLTGGQPVSLGNLREVKKVADKHHVPLIIDACLIAENAFFIKQREPEFKDASISEIIHQISKLADIIYFSARKLSASRGGGIALNRLDLFNQMKELIPLFEGFFTYGGISVREIESMAIGLKEFTDETVISQMPQFIDHCVKELDSFGIPVVTPGGALGIHLDAKEFLPHIPQLQYPAGALAAALFIISGVRGMERGTISMDRDPDTGQEIISQLELVRLAVPRRVFTLSQLIFLNDRLIWLFKNRDLIGGLKFVDEPKVLRFFDGKLAAVSNWPEKLVEKFKQDFGDSL